MPRWRAIAVLAGSALAAAGCSRHDDEVFAPAAPATKVDPGELCTREKGVLRLLARYGEAFPPPLDLTAKGAVVLRAARDRLYLLAPAAPDFANPAYVEELTIWRSSPGAPVERVATFPGTPRAARFTDGAVWFETTKRNGTDCQGPPVNMCFEKIDTYTGHLLDADGTIAVVESSETCPGAAAVLAAGQSGKVLFASEGCLATADVSDGKVRLRRISESPREGPLTVRGDNVYFLRPERPSSGRALVEAHVSGAPETVLATSKALTVDSEFQSLAVDNAFAYLYAFYPRGRGTIRVISLTTGLVERLVDVPMITQATTMFSFGPSVFIGVPPPLPATWRLAKLDGKVDLLTEGIQPTSADACALYFESTARGEVIYYAP